jgi:fibronectin-binding autotransporter adhesin
MKPSLKSSTALVAIAAALLMVSAFRAAPAFAACTTVGVDTTCSAASTSTIGRGPSSPLGSTVTLNPNAQISVGNANAISLGDIAVITLNAGATVQNRATSGTGLWNAGNNTIEFGSNGLLTVAATASVQSLGTQPMPKPSM